MFLLDRNFQWRATFIDESWDAAELRTWMKRADSPGVLGWFAMNPEMLVYIGFGGMLLSLTLILGSLIRRPRSLPNGATSK
jgi:hypothetical protein